MARHTPQQRSQRPHGSCLTRRKPVLALVLLVLLGLFSLGARPVEAGRGLKQIVGGFLGPGNRRGQFGTGVGNIVVNQASSVYPARVAFGDEDIALRGYGTRAGYDRERYNNLGAARGFRGGFGDLLGRR